MKFLFSYLVLVASFSGLVGCASVTKTPVQNIAVKSVPAGATVRTSNGKSGVTPFSFLASRKNKCRLTVSLAGYQPINVILTSRPSTTGKIASAGNAIVGGLVGVAIDQLSGSTMELAPDPVLVRLSPLTSPTPSVMLPQGSKIEESFASQVRSETGEKIKQPKPTVKPLNVRPVKGTDATGTEYL